MSKAGLIIISGPPCAGKTTLAERIAEEFRLPLINKDGIKESLFNSLGIGDSDWSHKLSVASYSLVYYIVESLVKAGDSLIVEGNFRPDYDSKAFLEIHKKYFLESLQIYCHTKVEVMATRYKERSESGTRHPGHLDKLVAQNFEKDMLRGRYKPLNIKGEIVRIDTTDFSKINYGSLYAKIRNLLENAKSK